jgi:membrane protease YdiL (CAAX protease family)
MIDYLLPTKSLLKINWKISVVIFVSTLILITSHYNLIFQSKEIDHFFYYLIIPLSLVIFIFRENPSHYGFQIGDWKAGLIYTGLGWIATLLIMYFVAQTSDFKGYYASQARPILQLTINTGLDLIGWEFLFRGLLLFALIPVCGPYAILIQAIPFTIAHIGKPELETLSCIFGGSLFGLIAWRTRSFLYPFLIHWFLAFITIYFASMAGR